MRGGGGGREEVQVGLHIIHVDHVAHGVQRFPAVLQLVDEADAVMTDF